MTKNYKILAKFIKDASSETADIETYLFVKENISKYHLDIDIKSKTIKSKIIEVNTTLKFHDKELNEKKSHFEIVYASIVKIDDEIKKNEKERKRIWNLEWKERKKANKIWNKHLEKQELLE